MHNRQIHSVFSHFQGNVLSKAYHVHFMKGRSNEILSNVNQEKFCKFIAEDPNSASFLTYDRSSVQNKILNWTQKLPWIQPHYAVKSNPIQQLIKDVHSSKVFRYYTFQVCGFDCASKNEIKSVLKLGCNPADVIFSNSIKIVILT